MPFSRRGLLIAGAACAAGRMACAQGSAAEAAYTVTLPDKQKLRVRPSLTPDGRGGRVARVASLPRDMAPGPLLYDTSVNLGADARPAYSRLTLATEAGVGVSVEATRVAAPGGADAGGLAFRVRVPEEVGLLPFGATLFSPLLAELFVGRLYDFRKAGEQTFAMLLDYGPPPTRIVTLKLTAEGGAPQPLNLPDGAVKARRIRYAAAVPFLPREQQTGVFYIGPQGEVLKCDTAFFGVPLQAKGPAAVEEGGRRLILRFANPDSGGRVVVLRADRRGSGYDVTLEFENGGQIATLGCDDRFRLTRLETGWRGRPLHATVEGAAVRYRIEAGIPTVQPAPSGRAWFPPHWYLPEVWEGEGGTFAGLEPGGRHAGDYFPLIDPAALAQPFTLERMSDDAATYAGRRVVVHRYRFLPADGKAVYDLYTDGTRLIAFLSSDGISALRDTWDVYTAGLKTPAPAK